MNSKYKPLILIFVFILILVGIAVGAIFLVGDKNVAVLNPQGIIADKEKELMIIGVLLSLIVIIPVYVLTIGIVLRYREGNTKAKYTPSWDRNRILEFIWWAIPSAIILVLSVVVWVSSHSLDPYKPLNSTEKPMVIQVVALDWKWLFIYPEQNIATVNFVQIPENTPIDFEITSDTVMNSFWVPNLGGQIYAMPGMSTHLHLMSDKLGSFPGSSANISGKGFANMNFTVKSSSKLDFDAWVEFVKKSPNILNSGAYSSLAKPGIYDSSVAYYRLEQPNLYDSIVMKYMMPSNQINAMDNSGANVKSTKSEEGGYMQ